MNANFAKTLVSVAALAAAGFAGSAVAAGSSDTFAGDKYGYVYRADSFDTFTQGARAEGRNPFVDGARKVDPYTDGARKADPFTDGARKVDPYTDGARIAGLDRTGVSATPQRTADPYTDGARQFDPYTDGARKVDPFTDGALA
ncbi:hypothetical protein L602_000400000090 [Cupriavidus gilardii J11]|uniref:Copper resistance protein CopQ n=1 Tax=Cupriavidus gilardii J11 TaxID=936133 RepID=A0A562B9V8_9BURK|nr:hypothetical protein [Cupriavidus gilardii]TWG81690.1 hypothetical protein L602_000400000090 [Cupriavidus gilardii J11]